MAKPGSNQVKPCDYEDELAGLDWLRDQVINDNNLEICETEEERVSMLAMLSHQKQRRKKAIKDDQASPSARESRPRHRC